MSDSAGVVEADGPRAEGRRFEGPRVEVAVVTPVYGNETTLPELARRLTAALVGRTWRLRIVVDASPDASLSVARGLAAADPRIAVTALDTNVGQPRALAIGLGLDDWADAWADDWADAWVCLDADLQDPPEAVPALLDRLAVGDVGAVFAGRRGTYESRARMVTGRIHRAVMGRVTGLPADAGAFVAIGSTARRAVVELGAPSIVAAIGAAGVALASVPVQRHLRPSGRSAWTTAARLRQSAHTLAWAVTTGRRGPHDRPPSPPGATLSQRCTTVPE